MSPPPSQVRSKLWKQRNCVTFYEEVSRGTGGGGDLEGGYGGAPNRTISFATPARAGGASAVPQGSRRPSIDILRAPMRGRSVQGGGAVPEFGMDTQPPNWSNQQPGGVWEVNVAPMGRELAEDHAPSKAGRRKGSKKQEQLGTSGGLVSTQL